MTNECIYFIKQIETERASVTLRSDDIILVEIRSDDEFELDQAKQATKAIEQISDGKKHPVLILSDKFTLPTSEVRQYMASPESAPFTSAEAYILTSFTQKLVGNIYLNFNKPVRPTKFFISEEKAIEWLKTFI